MKRHLTQSEKHRYFVEGNAPQGSTGSHVTRYHAARIVECPQNAVELRKFLQQCQSLERAKNKSISSLTCEKHLLTIKYKDLLSKERSPDLEDSFLATPGFRFKRNGDIKKLKKSKSTPTTFSHVSLASSKKTSKLEIAKKEVKDGEKNKMKQKHSIHRTLRNELDALEKELEEIKSNKELRAIHNKLGEVKSSLTFLRAHSKEPLQSPKQQTSDQCQGRTSKQSFHGGTYGQKLVKSSGSSKISKGRKQLLAERLSRKLTKTSCVACEFRLKNTIEKNKARQVSTAERWKIAPSGTYVKRMEPSKSESKSKTKSGSRQPKKLSGTEPESSQVTSSSPVVGRTSCNQKGDPNKPRGQTPIRAVRPTSSEPCCRPRPARALKKEADKPIEGTSRSSQRNAPGQKAPQNLAYSTESTYQFLIGRSAITNKDNLEMIARLSSSRPVTTSSRASVRQTQSARTTLSRPWPTPLRTRPTGSANQLDRAASNAALKSRAQSQVWSANQKVRKFLDGLPEVTPSIDKWVSSSGQIVRAEDKRQKLSADPETNMAAGDDDMSGKESKDDVAFNCDFGLYDDVGLDNDVGFDDDDDTQKINTQPGSANFDKLQKCRYLRLRVENGVEVSLPGSATAF